MQHCSIAALQAAGHEGSAQVPNWGLQALGSLRVCRVCRAPAQAPCRVHHHRAQGVEKRHGPGLATLVDWSLVCFSVFCSLLPPAQANHPFVARLRHACTKRRGENCGEPVADERIRYAFQSASRLYLLTDFFGHAVKLGVFPGSYSAAVCMLYRPVPAEKGTPSSTRCAMHKGPSAPVAWACKPGLGSPILAWPMHWERSSH